MNKIKTISINTTKTITKNITTEKYGDIICIETHENEVLKCQYFKPITPYHNGYEPKNMCFEFFNKKIDLIRLKEIETDYKAQEKEYKQVLIYDLESFNDFDKLYCIWTSMDGKVYSLTEKDPLDYPNSYDLWEKNYDLDSVYKLLKNNENISDLRFEKTIWSNIEICGPRCLYFNYVWPEDLKKKILNKSKKNSCSYYEQELVYKLVYKYLGLNKFRKQK